MFIRTIVTLTILAGVIGRSTAVISHHHHRRCLGDFHTRLADWASSGEDVPTIADGWDSRAMEMNSRIHSASRYVVSAVPNLATSISLSENNKRDVVSISGKRGLAFNNATLANLFGASCSNCSWGYNWGSSSRGLNSRYSYVPMLWSDDASLTSQWDRDAEIAISSGASSMFSFNEPDNVGQANMLPQAAAAAHIKYLNKYGGRVKIGAPAVTNSVKPGEGIQWLEHFLNACGGQCHVDFCNVHWYAPAEDVDNLFEHLEKAHEACAGKPVWLTEFAPVSGDIQGFLRQVIPKLESMDYVEAYSYFMVALDSLMSSASTLSSFGEVYAALPA
ncbi:glycoside hydrolase [Purpureocillium lilacinum]|uniref:Glycoside hydrolase n=1 Tax=Purpureocillium lilacinum TaxID=33203 RepID=A0A179F5W0_PURLI|nr:glycoside hydrolase [Purpureocillium lilacinum]